MMFSSSLCNAGCPRLTIISLVIASGPGDFFNFRFYSELVNSSYDNGKFITVDTSHIFVCVAQLANYLLLCMYQQKCWVLVSHGPCSCLVEVLS